MVTALAGYVHNRWDIPLPSEPIDDQVSVPVPAIVAAKLALYTAMRSQRTTKVELARRLGVSESAVRKLTNPDHRSHMSQVQKALRAVGRNINVEVTAGEGEKVNRDFSDYFQEFVGTLFCDLGCRMENQPPIKGRRSDYLATTPDGESLNIEDTVLKPRQFSEPRPTEEDVCRKLDEICRVPDLYWFWAAAAGELYQYISKKQLEPIKRWIERLSTQRLKPQSAYFSFPSDTSPRDVEAPSRVWK